MIFNCSTSLAAGQGKACSEDVHLTTSMFQPLDNVFQGMIGELRSTLLSIRVNAVMYGVELRMAS